MARPVPKQACNVFHRLSKATLIAVLPEGSRTRTWFEDLNDDQWEITSFDPHTRNVCVDVTTDSGTRHVNVTLPNITPSKPN